jgi:hypothetical protein
MHACSPTARLAPSHDGAFLRGAKPFSATQFACKTTRQDAWACCCLCSACVWCMRGEASRLCRDKHARREAGKYTASSGGIQTWRRARGMPMQTGYACAMTVAFLTPQTKTWKKKNQPTRMPEHQEQEFDLYEKIGRNQHNERNKSIA